MAGKCATHNAEASAYCRTHRLVLCIKCLIQNVHKQDGEECVICPIDEVNDEIEKLLIANAAVKQTLSEVRTVTEKETSHLTGLNDELTERVNECFGNHVKYLEEKKDNTLRALKTNVERKRMRNQSQTDQLNNWTTRVTQMDDEIKSIKTAEENSKHGERLDALHREIVEIGSKLENMSTGSQQDTTATFIAFPRNIIYSERHEGYLGTFEFSDELYEPIDEPPPIPTKSAIVARSNSTMAQQKQRPTTVTRRHESSSFSDSERLSGSLNNPLYGEGQVPGTRSNVWKDTKEFKVKCTDTNSESRCIIRKLESVADKQLAIFDSAHNKIMYVNIDGKLIDTLMGSTSRMTILDMCLVKTESIAVFCKGGDDTLFISIQEVTKKSFKHKQIIDIIPTTITIRDLDFLGFEVEPKSLTFALTYADKVLKIHKGINAGLLRKNNSKVEEKERPGVLTMFDFQGSTMYTLNTDRKALERCDLNTGEVPWAVDSSSELFNHFMPLKMRHFGPKYLVVMCPGQFFVFCKETGKLNGLKRIDFDTECDAFCVRGKGVVVGKVQPTNTRVIKLTEYVNILK